MTTEYNWLNTTILVNNGSHGFYHIIASVTPRSIDTARVKDVTPEHF